MKPNVRGKWLKKTSTWRKISLNTWKRPDNASVFGMLELDAGPLQEYLKKKSEETGTKCTVTHAVTRAVAIMLARYPHCNILVRGHSLWQRKDVDIFLQVAMPMSKKEGKADLSGAIIRQADTKHIEDIAGELRDQATAVREKRDGEMAETRSMLKKLPSFAVRWGLKTLTFIQYDLNIAVPTTPRDPFGSAMVTSVGMFGISQAFAPLVTFTRAPIVILCGQIEDRPVVRDGKIVIRPILTLCCTFDHRIFDGYEAGLLAKTISSCIEDPELLDGAASEL